MIISLIVAIGKSNQIGLNNKMLWHVPEDFKNFKKVTMGHCIVMGRKTYESIGRLLPGRTSIILTRDKGFVCEGAHVFHSKQEIIDFALTKNEDELFIIGGSEIYDLFIEEADQFYMSKIDFDGPADKFFPSVDFSKLKLIDSSDYDRADKVPSWTYRVYKKISKGC